MNTLLTRTCALLLASTLWSCQTDDDQQDINTDLQAPSFDEVTRPRTQGGSGTVKVRGEWMEVRSETSTHLHVRGTLTDNVALGQMRIDIHGSNDGHTHGRTTSQLLPGFLIDSVVDLVGARAVNFDKDLYYDDRDYQAGPYHVILTAVDQAGNATSYADGSNVVRSIYLKRPYMPLIALAGDETESLDRLTFAAGAPLALDGFLEQRRAQRDFSVSFVRVSIVPNTDREDNRNWGANASYVQMWGRSIFLRDNTGGFMEGDALPIFDDKNRVMLDQVLGNYTLQPSDQGRALRLEVEDTAGNLAVREFVLTVN